MRRSTAAAVGTLTGAALIVGVRLSVQPPAAPVAAQAPVDLANAEPAPKESSKKPAAKDGAKKGEQPEKTDEAAKNGLKNGVFKGKGSTNPYGTIQVSIRVDNGKITAATATYPLTGDS